jgi:hypothetical protein
MIKRVVFMVGAVLIFVAAQAQAQQPTFAQIGGGNKTLKTCNGAQVYGALPWCFDWNTQSNPGIYYNNGGTWTLVSGGGGGGLTPTFTSVTTGTLTATGTGDKTVNIANGGHLSNPIGTGTPPTTGTGSVVAGGTDTAMRVTGGTSPVTVTFGTAFAVAPVCVCSNGTTAADGCKTSAEGTTSVVVTTAGTDTFSLECIGK